MEEIIQILVFAGVMIVSVVIQSAKNKKKPKTVSPQEVLEDIFPDLKEFQEVSPIETETVKKPVVSSKKKPFKAKSKPVHVEQPVPSSEPQKKERIRLNSRKEARKAFIYSEIFNRKY